MAKVEKPNNNKHSKPQQPQKPVKRLLPFLAPDPNPSWKLIFYGTVIVASLVMLISGWGTGFHSDEMDQNAYGKAAISFYATGGKDTSYLSLKLPDGEKVAEAIRTYGVLVDMGMNMVTRFAPIKYEYDIRHVMIQIFGLLGMFFASLITLRLTGGYRSALITFIIIYLTPTFFGHSLMNSRDIPFATGYTLALYAMIVFMQNFKTLTYKHTILFALAVGFSMSVRIGGLILYVVMGLMLLYLALFNKPWRAMLFDKSRLKRYVIHGALLLLIPYCVAVISHPYIISSPLKHFMYCIQTAQRFPNRIPLAYKGEFIDSLTIPSDFIPTWMGITIPVVVFVLFAIGLIFLLLKWSRIRQHHYFLLLLIAFSFPIVYAIANSFALYTGWRHLLFVYPAMAILAAYWLEFVSFRNAKLNFLMPVILLATMSHPIYWMTKNHPYEYIYFNEISGGFARNYDRFETDGWQLSVREALEWVRNDKNFNKHGKTIIGTNAYSQMLCMQKDYYNDTFTDVQRTGIKAMNLVDWDYLIINVNMIPPTYLREQFPPAHTIKTISIDGKAICAIVYDTVRNDFKGVQAVQNGDLKRGDSLLTLALKEAPMSEHLLATMANCKASMNDWEASYKASSLGLSLYPDNGTMLYYYAIYSARNNQFKVAIDCMLKAFERGYPETKFAVGQLAQMYKLSGNEAMYKRAINLANTLKE